MRVMQPEEMRQVVQQAKWATLCLVDSQSRPYAMEATPFEMEGDICFMINPRGTAARCLAHCPHVLLKYTLASARVDRWAGVSCLGTGRFDADVSAMRRGWLALGQRLGVDYSTQMERFAVEGRSSPLMRVQVEKTTGRCSHDWQSLLITPDPA